MALATLVVVNFLHLVFNFFSCVDSTYPFSLVANFSQSRFGVPDIQGAHFVPARAFVLTPFFLQILTSSLEDGALGRYQFLAHIQTVNNWVKFGLALIMCLSVIFSWAILPAKYVLLLHFRKLADTSCRAGWRYTLLAITLTLARAYRGLHGLCRRLSRGRFLSLLDGLAEPCEVLPPTPGHG